MLRCPWFTRWRSCLTLISDGVIGIFCGYNPSGRTMALGSTQPLTEMSTRNISWGGGGGGKGGRYVGLPTSLPSCDNCLEILGASTSWNPQGLSRPVQRLLYLSDIHHRQNQHYNHLMSAGIPMRNIRTVRKAVAIVRIFNCRRFTVISVRVEIFK
jgi:hypothetical protein